MNIIMINHMLLWHPSYGTTPNNRAEYIRLLKTFSGNVPKVGAIRHSSVIHKY